MGLLGRRSRGSLSNINQNEGNYNFRLYAYTPRWVMPNPFYAQLSREVLLEPQLSTLVGIQFLLVMIAPTSLSLKLESGESMITYSPQHMLRHFDYDQGTAWMAGGTVSMSWKQNPAMWEMTESAYRGFSPSSSGPAWPAKKFDHLGLHSTG